MERKDFLKIALYGTLATCACGLSACKKEDMGPSSSAIPAGGLKIDLNADENTALRSVGGSRVLSGVIVVHYQQDDFRALSVACTHQGTAIIYQSGTQNFRCPNHNSLFDIGGKVVQGPANKALKVYTVNRDGNVLNIT